MGPSHEAADYAAAYPVCSIVTVEKPVKRKTAQVCIECTGSGKRTFQTYF